MKMTKEHYNMFKKTIEDFLQRPDVGKLSYYVDHYENAGYSNERLRWSLFWRANSYQLLDFFRSRENGYNDNHIDAALRKIVKEILARENGES